MSELVKLVKLTLVGDEEINKMKQMVIFEREYSENAIKGFRETYDANDGKMDERRKEVLNTLIAQEEKNVTFCTNLLIQLGA